MREEGDERAEGVCAVGGGGEEGGRVACPCVCVVVLFTRGGVEVCIVVVRAGRGERERKTHR